MRKLLFTLPFFAALAHAERVLFVVTAANQFVFADGTAHPVGYFLNELSEPLRELRARGVEVDFASPDGVTPTVDTSSLNPFLYFAPFGSSFAEASLVASFDPGLRRPQVLESFGEEELAAYDGVFVPGGHGVMQDLVASPAMGRVLEHFHRLGKPTGLICHGTAAMLSTATPDGGFLYGGYRMTAFSKPEEKLFEWTTLKRAMPWYVDVELARRGARLQNVLPPFAFQNVVRDRELITAQNPFSSAEMSRVFADAIAGR